ncbi:MAG: glycoside hydrolase family 57 protein [Myxococcota bacterium]
MGTLHVCFLWHMHQPPYADPLSGAVTMPWVRLHAVKDYTDMALALEATPHARATVNWVPSLLDQLEAVADPDYPERESFWRLSLAPVESLDAAERATIAQHFFSLDHERMLEPWPRYAELRARAATGDPLHDEEIRDLQIWFNLAWLGADARSHPTAERLFAKSRGFDDDDKRALAELHRDVAARVIPRWAALAASGRVELCCSPAYHPILPLLCDTDLARAADPTSPLPRERFRHPDDARAQVQRAIASHTARFGAAPAGMWPSEGSVAAPVAALAADAGLRWLATDEALLARALGRAPALAERLTPWSAGPVALFFRDHELSDRIGFVYASWDHAAARADFTGRLDALARDLRALAPGKDGVVTIALDGENCWETYDGGVMGFLPELYAAIARTPGLRLSTLSEALAAVGTAGRALPEVPAGSWIDGTFRTWLGDPVKNRAWDALTAMRAAVAQPMDQLIERTPEIAELVMRAEASDWFWWFGEGHSSAFDGHFDALFRAHLRAVYDAIGVPSPLELDAPLDPGPAQGQPLCRSGPLAAARPRLTGVRDAFFQWTCAGHIEPDFGAIHRARSVLRRVLFLGAPEGLSLRVLTDTPPEHALAGLTLRLLQHPPPPTAPTLWPPAASAQGVESAHAEVLDLFVPSAALVLCDGHIHFALELADADGRIVERLPREGYIAAPHDPAHLVAHAWLA